MAKHKTIEKLESLFKEESWGRLEAKNIGISKFKVLDNLFNSIVSDNLIDEVVKVCNEQLEESSESFIATYLIGLIGYHESDIESAVQLRKLIELFTRNSKWAVVELIAEKILEFGENSIALKALATSFERQGRNREAIPVWENLLRIDRFDAEVAKKLAYAILDHQPENAVHFIKLSIEGFMKMKNFDEVGVLWNKLVTISWEDISFFERIERMLVDAKQEEQAALLLKGLLIKYREDENVNQSIELLKKILKYRSDDTGSRRELIGLYRQKYEEHSQLEQFLKLSELTNYRAPVKYAIEDFEKNIIFDIGNYVYHISWGIGQIDELDNEKVLISFKDKPGHKMSIKMALQSLTPMSNDHIYVQEYKNPELIKELFTDSFMDYFELLIKSYDGKITLSDIKREVIPNFVDQDNWAKWWSKTRTAIKKDPLFGVSEKKKDLIFMRDKPVTFADELLENFTKTDQFSDKLNTCIEFLNNIGKIEGAGFVQYFIDFFTSEAKGSSKTRLLLSYFVLNDLSGYLPDGKVKLDAIRDKVITFVKESDDLVSMSMKISSYDYKKDFVNIIVENREDWPQVISKFLYETPVRIHKYIINILLRNNSYSLINNFIDNIISGWKQYPEIFIWVSKNLLSKSWAYDWLDFSSEGLVASYFRLMNELKKIEVDSNKMKNQTMDFLFDDEAVILKAIVSDNDETLLNRLFDVFTNLSNVGESNVEMFHFLISEKFPEFQQTESSNAEDDDVSIEKSLIVTEEGKKKKQVEHDQMINVNLVEITKELANVSEAASDVRENNEYNALLEKQSVLKLSISKVEEEMKQAVILDIANVSTDIVSVGTTVSYEMIETGEKNSYTILGPWDADFENGILSYRSPIAKSLIGKKIGDETIMIIDDEEKKFKILEIKKYI